MSDTREFHLGDILSITTELLVSPRHVGGVYDILNFMTGDTLWTHQLPRAGRECRPWLERQHPHLSASALAPDVEALSWRLSNRGEQPPEPIVEQWLAGLVEVHGEMHPVRPIPNEEHEVVDPFIEAMEQVGPERVFAVNVDGRAPEPGK
jgi:hypothetical protein